MGTFPLLMTGTTPSPGAVALTPADRATRLTTPETAHAPTRGEVRARPDAR